MYIFPGSEKKEYKINELAKISGVSTCTLRYYDEIGLLIPERVDTNGYRVYQQEHVNRLQQILFYRELAVALERVNEVRVPEPILRGEMPLRSVF